MKKSVKVLLIVISSLVALILLVALLVSPIAKRYVEKNSKALVGRTVTMEKLRINIFTGRLRIENFMMQEAADTTHFVAFDRFETQIKLLPILRNKFIIQRLLLSGADIRLLQEGSNFNFDDIIAHFSSEEEVPEVQPDENAAPWEIGLYNIEIANSRVFYKDQGIQAVWDMKDLNLKVPGVYFSNQSTEVGVNLNFTDGGSLHTDLKYDIAADSYTLTLSLKDFSLRDLLPYLQQSMNVGEIAGTVSADVSVSGNMKRMAELDINVAGTLVGHAVALKDTSRRNLVSVDSLYIKMEQLNPGQAFYRFDKVYIAGVESGFELYKNGDTNFTSLLKEPEEGSVEEEQLQTDSVALTATADPLLLIKDIELLRSSFAFSDHTLVQPFEYRISDITLRAKDFNPSVKNHVKLSATLAEAGKANVKWDGSIDDMSNLNLTLTLKNVDFKNFTPYALHYFGYPLDNGTLSFTSQNVVKQNMLNGVNVLDAYKVEVGNKDKTIKSEFNLPLKLGLYVLKDKSGKINMSLPVKGNIDSPEFSYKKIIIQAFMNVLVKVATAPLSFLANSLGIKGDGLESIPFDPLYREFTSEQYEKFGELAQVVKLKPELQMTLQQEINYHEALQAYTLMLLKKEYYTSQHPNKANAPLEMLDFNEIMAVDLKSQPVLAFVDALLVKNGKPVEGDMASKAATLFSEPAKARMLRMADARNVLLREHMVTKLGVPDSLLLVKMLPLDSLQPNKKHSHYSVSMEFAGESDGANE